MYGGRYRTRFSQGAARSNPRQRRSSAPHLDGFESCFYLEGGKGLPPNIWCGQQDSNLHAYAMEPKGDVTLVNVLRCVKNTFLNNSNGYYRNAQVSSFVGDISILLFHQLAVYFLLGNAVDEKSNVLHLSSFEPAN